METELTATTEERFELICKVHKEILPYREHQSRGKEWNEQASVILLIPETTDQASGFYDAWLPIDLPEVDGKPPCHEIGMEVGYPVGGFMRGAVFHSSPLYPERHIFVMSNRAEKILQNRVGEKIRVTVLGEQEFDQAYEAKAETKSPYSNMP